MKISDFNNGIKTVLTEMCKRVGADADKIDFKEEGWFMQHSWTQSEEEDFIKWVTDYLYTDKQARIDIMNSPSKRKGTCKKAATYFVWNYGWKTNLNK